VVAPGFSSLALIIAAPVIVAVVVAFVLFKAMWRVA